MNRTWFVYILDLYHMRCLCLKSSFIHALKMCWIHQTEIIPLTPYFKLNFMYSTRNAIKRIIFLQFFQLWIQWLSISIWISKYAAVVVCCSKYSDFGNLLWTFCNHHIIRLVWPFFFRSIIYCVSRLVRSHVCFVAACYFCGYFSFHLNRLFASNE